MNKNMPNTATPDRNDARCAPPLLRSIRIRIGKRGAVAMPLDPGTNATSRTTARLRQVRVTVEPHPDSPAFVKP